MAGSANAANGPVGGFVPEGCATAFSSTPSALLIASMNCCALILRRNTASGSPLNAAIAARVAARPRASAGTDAEGFIMVKSLTASVTAASIAPSSAGAPAGGVRVSALNRPGIDVSMPSKKLASLAGAVTRLARRL